MQITTETGIRERHPAPRTGEDLECPMRTETWEFSKVLTIETSV